MFSTHSNSTVIQRILVLSLATLFCAVPAMAQETASDVEEITPDETPAESPPAPEPEPEPEIAPPPPAAPAPEPEPAPVAEPAAAEPEEEEEEASTAGVNVDVGIASIYNFRGYNSFQESSQQNQNAAFFPSITWSIFDSGVYLGYWGAYQITGHNKALMVDSALGHEQDLYVGYDLGLADDLLTLSFAFTYFFYPFADEDVAGTANPSIIEPLIGFSVATIIDIGFTVSYFHGIQEEIEGLRHAYFKFSLGKGFEFNKTFGMNIGAGFGAKAWIEDINSNRFDLVFDWSVPISLTDQLYVEPGIHLAWTDLEGDNAGEEYMIYGSVNVGADF